MDKAKVIDYVVVFDEFPHFLEDRVKRKLAEGWHLYGGVSSNAETTGDNVRRGFFAQAMVKYESSE